MFERAERASAKRRLARATASGAARARPEAGTEALPQIKHIVILMMENHSYDNYFGMLDRGGAGFTLGPDGKPTGTSPRGDGTDVALWTSTRTAQEVGTPTQSWNAAHIQWNEGKCDGFVRSVEQACGAGADATAPMRYWTEAELPFYYGLARTFPLATRWFSSCLGPTFPNRRFMISGTANGLIDDLPYDMIDHPANGTIFDHLSAHGISWVNYHAIPASTIRVRRLVHLSGLRYLRLVLGGLAGVFPRLRPMLEKKVQVTADLYPLGFLRLLNHVKPVTEFYAAAAAGTLPSVCLVDPDFGASSEENPQDIAVGEALSARIINAVMAGPGWPHTLLIWLYDEHGGYYDHVPPPSAPAPDDVPARSPYERYPILRLLRGTSLGKTITRRDSGPSTYTQLGFRVPAVIVSPYAKPDYVMEQDCEHTAILRLIQRKWNLPSLTARDAVAADLLDALDLDAPPAFLTPPVLPAPGREASGRTPS
jgi:phospholipase C